MNHQRISSRLNDYVDDLLPDGEQREIERHLEGCEECRKKVHSLCSLLSDLATLPMFAPKRDLWPNILGKAIGLRIVSADWRKSDRRSVWIKRGMLAAAAIGLMTFSSVVTAFFFVRAKSQQLPK